MDSGCANCSCVSKRDRGPPRWVSPLEMDTPFAGQIGNADIFGGQNPDIGDTAGAAGLSVSGMATDRFGAIWFTDPNGRRLRVLEPWHGQSQAR